MAVDAAVRYGAIFDLNTAGYRKGLPTPYPAPWLLELVRDRGGVFCFGDDSHCVADVAAGIDNARRYLLDHAIDSVTVLTREDGRITKRGVPLI
jgi:histidinol-phosphatase (PHP family)